VTLDVPLSDSLDAMYLTASVVTYVFPGRIEQVGVEGLRVTAPARDVPISESQYTLLRMNAVSDGWVRERGGGGYTEHDSRLGPTARRVTLGKRAYSAHDAVYDAGCAGDIAISGTQILVHRSSVMGKGVWPVVTQQGVDRTERHPQLHERGSGHRSASALGDRPAGRQQLVPQRHRAASQTSPSRIVSTQAPATDGVWAGPSHGT
jgi:hypothetical protein